MSRIPVSANDIAASSGYDPTTGVVAALQTGTAASDANGTYAPLFTEDIEPANYIAASSPPASTNAGSDTTYTFSSQVNRVILQNNTASNVNIAFDATASAGSLLLLPGTLMVYPKKCTVLHLFTASAQTINGTTTGNIVVLGAL